MAKTEIRSAQVKDDTIVDAALQGNQFAGLLMLTLTQSRIDNWKSEDLPLETTAQKQSFFLMYE